MRSESEWKNQPHDGERSPLLYQDDDRRTQNSTFPSSQVPKNSTDDKSCLSFFTGFICLVVIASISVTSVAYFHLNDMIQQQTTDLFNQQEVIQRMVEQNTQLQSKMEAFQESITEELKRYEDNMRILQGFTLSETQGLEAKILILENATSNEDVLDELRLTKEIIYSDLQEERTAIKHVILEVKSNVSDALSSSSHVMDKKLSDVDRKLKISEKRVDNLLEQTYLNVSTSVQAAESHIRVVQTNLTSQMAVMSESVHSALESIGRSVKDAKEDISQEVQSVHDSLEQYFLFTNNQFAAEDDFVKREVAGNISLLSNRSCTSHSISLYHSLLFHLPLSLAPSPSLSLVR